MGNSLFGKLKSVLSRKKKSDISTAVEQPPATANLSRIGLGAGGMAAATPQPNPNMPDISGFAAAMTTGKPAMPSASPASHADVAPVGVQFFAEVPLQASAEEIVNVSRTASNCIRADMSPAGDGVWSVAITLNMSPVPQEIHTVESVLADWAGKLGGMAKGWGLAQGQAAA